MNEKLLIGVFVGVEGAHAFSAFCPSFFTIKAFVRTPDDVARLRSGYLPATAFNLILGGVTSALVKSPWPFILSAAISGIMVSAYEWALRGELLPAADGIEQRLLLAESVS